MILGLRLTLSILLALARHLFASRADPMLEILALRQQHAMAVDHNGRPRATDADRAFWVTLRCYFDRWADALVVVKPSTLTGWHR